MVDHLVFFCIKLYRSKRKFCVVDYDTASKNGEPFEMMIDDKKMLPHPCARFCTSELKVLTIERYMKSLEIDEWSTYVGIRADEPLRAAKMKMMVIFQTAIYVF